MKATLIFFILLCSNIVFAQHKKAVGVFNLGIDTYALVQKEVVSQGFNCEETKTIEDNNLLSEIYVEHYIWNNIPGTMEFYFGNGILYCVKFTSNTDNKEYMWVESKLWDKFKDYWD
jgi:hypothetical protein